MRPHVEIRAEERRADLPLQLGQLGQGRVGIGHLGHDRDALDDHRLQPGAALPGVGLQLGMGKAGDVRVVVAEPGPPRQIGGVAATFTASILLQPCDGHASGMVFGRPVDHQCLAVDMRRARDWRGVEVKDVERPLAGLRVEAGRVVVAQPVVVEIGVAARQRDVQPFLTKSDSVGSCWCHHVHRVASSVRMVRLTPIKPIEDLTKRRNPLT